MTLSSNDSRGNCCRLGKLSLSLSLLIALGAVVACTVGSQAEEAEEKESRINRDAPGIAEEPPDSLDENAQTVPIEEGGYMVPYEATIPGTEATYEMTPIPGGTFTMGSPADEEHREDDEGPQFEVEVDPFWMGKHNVTWAEYHRFMAMYDVFKNLDQAEREVTEDERADAITVPTPLYDPSTTYEFGDDERDPAVTMTQYSARQYTQWLSKLTGRFYRLPTEAEWEYAARAGTQTAWSFGDDMDALDDYVYHFGNAGDRYHNVGSLKPNPWGLYDIHGNVAELVIDQYIEDHYAQFEGGTVHWMDAIAWPTEPDPIVVRGGSWDHDAEDTRSAHRWQTDDENWKMSDPNLPLSPWWYTEFQGQATGFRLVRPLYEPDEATKRKFWGTMPEDLPEMLWFDVSDRLEEGRGTLGTVETDLVEKAEEVLEEE